MHLNQGRFLATVCMGQKKVGVTRATVRCVSAVSAFPLRMKRKMVQETQGQTHGSYTGRASRRVVIYLP